jgi:hypothetical protein
MEILKKGLMKMARKKRNDGKPRKGQKSFDNAMKMGEFCAQVPLVGGYFPVTREVVSDRKGFRSTSQVHDSARILEELGLLDPQGQRRGHKLEGVHIAVPINYQEGDFFGVGKEYDDLIVEAAWMNEMRIISKFLPNQVSHSVRVKPDAPMWEQTEWLSAKTRGMNKVAVVAESPLIVVPAVALDLPVYNPRVLLRAYHSEHYLDYILEGNDD